MAKKICIFSSHYFPYLGGVESYTYNLAKGLMKKGDKVVIVTSNDMGLKAYEKVDGIPVFRMPCFNLLAGRFPVSKPNKEYIRLHQKLMQVSFDLVIVNTRFYLHSVYGIYFARKQKTKCIVLDHGTSHMTIGNPFWDRVGSWYEHGITAAEKYLCKDFYGVSSDCCGWLSHFNITAKGTIYNAVDMDKMQALLQNPVKDFRKEYHIPDDGIVVTYTGRLLKEKGILNLIKAVTQYRGSQKLYLMIAGDGEELQQVQNQASDRVIPLGRLSFESVTALLGQTDIYCLPTDYPEGFPTSVLEAAAAQCFIITTTRGGSKELILDDSYGMIMENNQTNTIKAALEDTADKTEYRKKAARRAKDRLLKNFTWEIIAEQVHNL